MYTVIMTAMFSLVGDKLIVQLVTESIQISIQPTLFSSQYVSPEKRHGIFTLVLSCTDEKSTTTAI